MDETGVLSKKVGSIRAAAQVPTKRAPDKSEKGLEQAEEKEEGAAEARESDDGEGHHRAVHVAFTGQRTSRMPLGDGMELAEHGYSGGGG